MYLLVKNQSLYPSGARPAATRIAYSKLYTPRATNGAHSLKFRRLTAINSNIPKMTNIANPSPGAVSSPCPEVNVAAAPMSNKRASLTPKFQPLTARTDAPKSAQQSVAMKLISHNERVWSVWSPILGKMQGSLPQVDDERNQAPIILV